MKYPNFPFLFETLNPSHWSDVDQKFYPYKLRCIDGWREQTNITRHMVCYPKNDPWIKLLPTGFLWIRDGYLWDGPSGIAVDTPSFMRASLVHDCLYQLIEQKQLPRNVRGLADAEMRRICKEDGMGWFRRLYTWLAVRVFGRIWSCC